MGKHDRRQFAKAKRPKTKLGLPALDHSKSAVLNSLRSPESKRGYTHAIEEFIASEYSRTGFRGALNWYRGQDIFWQETPFLIGRKLLQPTLYVGGTDDAVVEFARPYVDNLEKSVPNLWNKVLLPGVGHWTEQEAPTEVNRLMVDFLRSVDAKSPAK